MIYEYRCEPCKKTFDVVKPAAESGTPESCACGAPGVRVPFPRKLHLSGTKVQEKYFSQAFGKVVTDNDVKQIVKERNLVEVGNEKPEKFQAPTLHNYDDVAKGA